MKSLGKNMPTQKTKLTPMMQQYLQIKQQHEDSILFFRLGDFYEMFFDDALKASEVLNIALTSRNKNQENAVPLCGIPYHSASQYIRKLIAAGHKVAICEQVEDPKQVKGIVKREVTRVVTPGLLVEDESLSATEANYLASFVQEGEGYHLGLVDISTGEILLGFYDDLKSVTQELLKHPIKEVLVAKHDAENPLFATIKPQLPDLLISQIEKNASAEFLNEEYFSQNLLQSWRALKGETSKVLVQNLLAYVFETQRSGLQHLGEVQTLSQRQYMRMDERTFRHLELSKNLHGEGRHGTLYAILNKTKTSMGARRLAKWIHYPLFQKTAIEQRLDAVQELFEHPEKIVTIQESLKKIPDIERMLGKLALSTVNARDLKSLGRGLQQAQTLATEIALQLQSSLFQKLFQNLPDLSELFEDLLNKIVEEPPLTIREGGLIAEGINNELDELRAISSDGKSFIARLEAKERERTKISSLKIRYNRVFGYYIEITHLHRDRVPEEYIRKQTLTNAERYITPELKDYESKVLGAEERIKSLEYELFCELRDECALHLDPIRAMAKMVSVLDVLVALAYGARENRYVRPEICEEKVLELEESRHPVLEQIHPQEKFIPNDLKIDGEEERLFLITGPNMAGKSTLMRQAALAVVMAQMGTFVPATRAKIGLVDQLFTRIGASDDLSQGQSTFMVEMLETANILQSATEKSFMVLDEIGRGTSTYDGMSIAWAVAEYVGKKIACRALFATHYHELIELGETVPGIVNYQIAVKEWNDEILFLRKLIPGGASRSYGIEVARLAGLPKDLLKRAREVLFELENMEDGALKKVSKSSKSQDQIGLFQTVAHPHQDLLDELGKISLDHLSPIEALNVLSKLQEQLKAS